MYVIYNKDEDGFVVADKHGFYGASRYTPNLREAATFWTEAAASKRHLAIGDRIGRVEEFLCVEDSE